MYNHEVPFLFTVNMYIEFYLNRLNFLIRMGHLIVANRIRCYTIFELNKSGTPEFMT